MIATNLKIVSVVVGTILFYTFLANAIPQVESEVPEELTLGADFTPEELVLAGEELYLGAGGCTACHGTGTRAPNIVEAESDGMIGERCAERVPGLSCKEYLHQSMVDPNGFLVDGFQPIMPDMSRTLSDAQVWALVAYMESLGGEVTVNAEDLAAAADAGAGAADAGAAAPAGGGPAPTATMEPMALLQENQCLVCHQLGDQGAPIGPPMTGIGERMDAEAIRHAILEPNAEITPGYEAVAGTMPATFGQQLSAAQLEAMVQYLATQ
ncbi:MAG: c-type cytochrome [Gemmatimonadota bacterium]